jgi:ABC-type taurine transport system substrate-binding protein
MFKHVARNFLAAFSFIAVVSTSLFAAEPLPAEVRFCYAGGPRVWVLGKIDESFDKSFGAKVKWVPFSSGAEVLTLFAAKEIDIARFGSSPAAAGIARKLPIEIIGVPEIIATAERLIARKGINSLKELEGKTVAYPANSTAQFAIKQNRLDQGGALLESAARQLVQRGAQTLILACTEVPVGLAHVHSDLLPLCVDPTQALADACIDYWRQARAA